MACDGRGKQGKADCPDCDRKGWKAVTGCVLTIVPPAAWRVLELATLWQRHGLPPVAGGVLDQAQGFVAAAAFVAGQRAAWRAKLGLSDFSERF
jgi:hypothetical protein